MNRFSRSSVLVSVVASLIIPVTSVAANTHETNHEQHHSTTTESRPATTKPTITVDFSCIKSTVTKREDTVITADKAFSTALQTALNARKSALDTAYSNTTTSAVRSAVKSAWDTFRTARKTAASARQAAIKAAWDTWKTEAKACKVAAPTTENSDTDQQTV